MKKFLIYVLAIVILLSYPIKSYAGNINDAEGQILGILGAVYEKDGYYWSVKGEYANKAYNYCMRDDVDLTYADVETARSSVYGYVGYEYFDIIGVAPSAPGPSDPEPTNPAPSNPNPSDSETGDSEDSTLVEETPVSVDEPVDEKETKDVSENIVEPDEPEVNEEGLPILYIEEAIKVPDYITAADNEALEAMIGPSKDYSNQAPIKKSPISGKLIVGIAIGGTVIILGTMILVHKNKGRKIFKR